MKLYNCYLPCFGTSDHMVQVTASNKRDAAKQASKTCDDYANKGKLTGHRMQRTPAAHWRVEVVA